MIECVWKVAEKDRLCYFCTVPDCDFRPTNKRAGKIMGRMREMRIGDWIFFPIGRWNAVRTSASKMKALYGVVFQVNRLGNEVRVKRNL